MHTLLGAKMLLQVILVGDTKGERKAGLSRVTDQYHQPKTFADESLVYSNSKNRLKKNHALSVN